MGRFNLADHIKPAVRDIDTITNEVLAYKRQAGDPILALGQRLNEAKELLPHGEWLPWLEGAVGFSERAAQQYMRLAREYTNPQALADLGATKALMLLVLPPHEREEFIEVPHDVDGEEKTVQEMKTRELEAILKEREEAKAEAATAEQARQKMEQDMAMAKQLLQSAQEERDRALQDARANAQEAVRLEKELEALRNRPVDVAVEVDQEAIAAARKETEAAMQAKLDKAKAAKEQAEQARKAAEEAQASAKKELEQLRAQLTEQSASEAKRTAIAGNKDLSLFEMLLTQTQENLNKMSGIRLKLATHGDTETAEKLSKLLLALSEKVREAAK